MRKRLLGMPVVLALLFLLVLPLALAVWLLASESAARLVLPLAGGTALKLTGIHGRLAGPLRIERIVVAQQNQEITFDDVKLDWRPQALLRGTLHITSLQAGKMGLTKKIQQEEEPLRLPDALGLPLRLQVDHLQVDAGEIRWGALNLIQLGGFSLGLQFDGQVYLLQLKQLSASGKGSAASLATRLDGQLQLDSRPPYALTGKLTSGGTANLQGRELGLAGQLDLSGSLEELHAALAFSLGQARAEGKLVLQPFSMQNIKSANVQVRELDLSALRADLPQTRIAATLATTGPDSGRLSLTNHAAGRLDLQALPLRSLQVDTRRLGKQLVLENLEAVFGSAQAPAGSLKGQGTFTAGALNLDLQLAGLDLRQLDQRLLPTRLAGHIAMRGAAGIQTLTLDLNEPRGKQNLGLTAEARLSDSRLEIVRSTFSLAQARLSASGLLELAGDQAFSAKGDLHQFRLQDLGNFPQMPALELNGKFTLAGARLPQLSADLEFAITDSKLAGQALSGAGQAQLRAERLLVPQLLLVAGENQLKMEGELAQETGQLNFSLKTPRLAALGAGFGGALDITGSARGKLGNPRIEAVWNGTALEAPGGYRLARMAGKTAFSPMSEAPLALDVQVEGINTPQLRADRFSAMAEGTTARHVLRTTLIEAEARQTWQIDATGGLVKNTGGKRWQGQITRFDASGRLAAKLAAPAPLALAAGSVQLDQFRLDAAGTSILLEQFRRNGDGISTRGQLRGLGLAQLLGFAGKQPAMSTNLLFDGAWDLKLADTLSGSIDLRRTAGDITIAGGTPLALGLQTLEASARAGGNGIELRLLAEGKQLGRIDLNARTQTSSRAALSGDTAMAGAASLEVPSLAWLGPLVSAGLLTEGQLSGAVQLSGSVANPQFAGKLGARKLRIFSGDSGVDLRDGVLDADFQGDQLVLKTFEFRNNGGLISATGPLSFSEGKPGAQIAIRAERYPLITRSDRKLVLSGQTKLDWAVNIANITGALTVDSGLFELGAADAPMLSDDVVIRGTVAKAPAGPAVAVSLNLNFGDGVQVRARGLDARLTGELMLTSAPRKELRATGTVRVAQGTYSAYGRKLAIEQGVLRFSGPLDNPALDIVAMRRDNLEVEAGVAVRGSVLAPRVTLVSEPSVPEAEKLSWLVLGHGLENAGNADFGALQSAAGALLSDGAAAGVQSQIATAFGLDDFKIGSTTQDNVQQRIVTLGKRLSSRLYVSYQQSLQSVGSVVLLRYTLSPRLSVELEAGTRSAISLFYNVAFD